MHEMKPTPRRRLPLLAAGAACLAACVPQPPPATPDQAALRACRARAEQIYAQQNRGTPDLPAASNTPYAAGGLPSDTTAGLSARYGYDQVVDRCLRGSLANTEIGSGAAAPAAPPGPVTRPRSAGPLAGPAPGAPLSAPPPPLPVP
jgi:hypothetical protein